MKNRFLLPTALVTFALVSASGCAVFSKGRSQMVTVHSNPEGATALINGEVVGKTPFIVDLKRNGSFDIELRKSGFAPTSLTVLPTENEYAKRFLRWGIDYDLGAMYDLTPGSTVVDLLPQLPPGSDSDRYLAMNYALLQADALLSAKEISASDHKALVAAITKAYTN